MDSLKKSLKQLKTINPKYYIQIQRTLRRKDDRKNYDIRYERAIGSLRASYEIATKRLHDKEPLNHKTIKPLNQLPKILKNPIKKEISEMTKPEKKEMVEKFRSMICSEEKKWCDEGYANKTVEQARNLEPNDKTEFLRKVKLCLDWAENNARDPTAQEDYRKKAKNIYHEIAGFVNDKGDCKPVLQ